MIERSLDISTLKTAYRSGDSSPAEIVDLIYRRIAAYADNPVWISLCDRAEVLAAAAKLQARLKHQSIDSLPLFGIPFAVKDNLDIAGMLTTAACPAFAYVASQTATAVQKLLDAGALLIGKTNLDQFATGLVGTRSPYGVCYNPFDRNYISGGSSSGSGLAVALGMASFSLGTDTAGSGRVPAAFTNIVGLKPTRGLISTAGVVPANRSLDCVSVFALNCADTRSVFEVAQGYDPADIYSRHPHETPALPQSLQIKSLRIGVPQPEQLKFFGDAEYQHLFEQSMAQIASLPAEIAEITEIEVVEIDFQPFSEAAKLLYGGGWIVERYGGLKDFLDRHPDLVLPVTKEILLGAEKFSATDVFETFHHLQALKQKARMEWQKMDLLLLPTTGTIYTITEIAANPIQLNSNLGYYTNFLNQMDLCAIAVPSGFRTDGLPFGITFIAPPCHEPWLWSVGTAYQQAVGGEMGAIKV